MDEKISKPDFQKEEEGRAGAFNMAFDTLIRLGNILKDIELLNRMALDPSMQQTIKINLVKDFFINASPLLKEEDVKKTTKVILKLKPISKQIINNETGLFVRNQIVYDENLDILLNTFLIDIQRDLQN